MMQRFARADFLDLRADAALPTIEPSPPPAPDTDGWSAKLRLCFAAKNERTVLVRKRQSGPLTVQRAFYPENGVCHIYLLHPPGGVVGGDQLQLNIGVGHHAHALITTPGASKFYRSAGALARQRQHVEIGPSGTLEWLPQETILFDGARADIGSRIDLYGNARFLGWEIYCLGRPSSGERFDHGDALLKLELFRDREPLLLEKLTLAGRATQQATAGLAGFAYSATLLATPADAAALALARGILSQYPALLAGATLLDEVLVLRCLGAKAETVKQAWLAVWAALRPPLLGCEPCAPRVWAT
jgi:urease accessory protein